MQLKRNKFHIRALAAFCVISIAGMPSFVSAAYAYCVFQGAAARHSLSFCWLLLVIATGWWGLRRRRKPWPAKLWLCLYGVSAILLLLSGVADMFIYPLPPVARHLAAQYRIFLVSPVIFAAIYLLTRVERTQAS